MEKYSYEAELGTGGYGSVWLCTERESGASVAVKRFKEAHLDPEIMRIALREVRLLKVMKHRNIVKLQEAFRSKSGRVYLVMEYIERTITTDLYNNPGGLPLAQVKLFMWQLCQAVAYLHKMKVMHRDIKPANILVSNEGVVKLCDFGFARMLHPRETSDYSSYVVTRWYRPPEVLVNDQYGPPIDIWALGCIFVELATGRALLPGKTNMDQLSITLALLGRLPEGQMRLMAADPTLAGCKVPAPTAKSLLDTKFPQFSSDMTQLLKMSLQLDPRLRPTAEELLAMPYFDDVYALLPQLAETNPTAYSAGADIYVPPLAEWSGAGPADMETESTSPTTRRPTSRGDPIPAGGMAAAPPAAAAAAAANTHEPPSRASAAAPLPAVSAVKETSLPALSGAGTPHSGVPPILALLPTYEQWPKGAAGAGPPPRLIIGANDGVAGTDDGNDNGDDDDDTDGSEDGRSTPGACPRNPHARLVRQNSNVSSWSMGSAATVYTGANNGLQTPTPGAGGYLDDNGVYRRRTLQKLPSCSGRGSFRSPSSHTSESGLPPVTSGDSPRAGADGTSLSRVQLDFGQGGMRAQRRSSVDMSSAGRPVLARQSVDSSIAAAMIGPPGSRVQSLRHIQRSCSGSGEEFGGGGTRSSPGTPSGNNMSSSPFAPAGLGTVMVGGGSGNFSGGGGDPTHSLSCNGSISRLGSVSSSGGVEPSRRTTDGRGDLAAAMQASQANSRGNSNASTPTAGTPVRPRFANLSVDAATSGRASDNGGAPSPPAGSPNQPGGAAGLTSFKRSVTMSVQRSGGSLSGGDSMGVMPGSPLGPPSAAATAAAAAAAAAQPIHRSGGGAANAAPTAERSWQRSVTMSNQRSEASLNGGGDAHGGPAPPAHQRSNAAASVQRSGHSAPLEAPGSPGGRSLQRSLTSNLHTVDSMVLDVPCSPSAPPAGGPSYQRSAMGTVQRSAASVDSPTGRSLQRSLTSNGGGPGSADAPCSPQAPAGSPSFQRPISISLARSGSTQSESGTMPAGSPNTRPGVGRPAQGALHARPSFTSARSPSMAPVVDDEAERMTPPASATAVVTPLKSPRPPTRGTGVGAGQLPGGDDVASPLVVLAQPAKKKTIKGAVKSFTARIEALMSSPA